MSTLNPIKIWINLFKTNPSLSVLRMTSRLLFIPGYFLFYYLLTALNVTFDPLVLLNYTFLASFILDFTFFEILRLKESSFKDERAFFKKYRFSARRIDAHARFITRFKAVIFALTFLFAYLLKGNPTPVLFFYVVFLPFISLLAYQLKVFQYHPLMKRYFAWIVRNGGSLSHVDQRRSSGVSGAPGYNYHGIYTGSSTAIGGISN